MFNKHSFFALLICFIGTFNIVFFTGFMSNILTSKKISDSKNFPINYVGFVYGS